ncbi:hypothetical protein LTR95_012821, partial [Oleoguttula sp. CCFEE 5521]
GAAKSVKLLTLVGKDLKIPLGKDFDDLSVGDVLAHDFDLDGLLLTNMDLSRTRPLTHESYRTHFAIPVLCMQIMRLCTGLEELTVGATLFEYAVFRNVWSAMRRTSDCSSLQNLRKCSLAPDVAKDVTDLELWVKFPRDWDAAMIMPLFASNMESVSAFLSLAPGSVSCQVGQPRQSWITHMNLHHYQDQTYELRQLLTATLNLRCFEYHAVVDWSGNEGPHVPEKDIGLEILYEALLIVGDTLEELVATQYYVSGDRSVEGGMERDHPLPDHHVENLQVLKRLRKLSLPYKSLLRRQARDASEREWHSVLPTTLHSLTLTNHLDENEWDYKPSWDDDSLSATFMTIRDWIALYTSEDDPSIFALRFDGIWDETFPARPWQEHMDRSCRDRHMRFSLEKPPWASFEGQWWPLT